MTPRRNEYTDTVKDIKALIRNEEADKARRERLLTDVDKMATQLERQREQLEVRNTAYAVLAERVRWLTWEVHLAAAAIVGEFIKFVFSKL